MNKTCNKCGASVPADQKFCTSCGGNEFTEAVAVQPAVAPVQPAVAPVQPAVAPVGAQPPKKGMPTWLKVILIILLVLGLMGACTVGCVVLGAKAVVDGVEDAYNDALEDLEDWESDYDYDYDYDYEDEDEEDTSTDTAVKTLGDTFTFDGFEITLGENVTYTTVDNQFSDYYGKDVIRVSATIKNNNSSTDYLSSLDYKFFGSQGSELGSLTYYFDDSVGQAGELRSGASYEKAFYLLYDGNGTYAIEFDDWFDDQVTVEFEITK